VGCCMVCVLLYGICAAGYVGCCMVFVLLDMWAVVYVG